MTNKENNKKWEWLVWLIPTSYIAVMEGSIRGSAALFILGNIGFAYLLYEIYQYRVNEGKSQLSSNNNPRVLCNQEDCVNNSEWRCSLDVIRIKGGYRETTRTSGYSYAECRDFKRLSQLDIKYHEVKEFHSKIHESQDSPYGQGDVRLWAIQTIHDLFREHLDVDLCWASCVHYAHEDMNEKAEDIALCIKCGYCGKHRGFDT